MSVTGLSIVAKQLKVTKCLQNVVKISSSSQTTTKASSRLQNYIEKNSIKTEVQAEPEKNSENPINNQEPPLLLKNSSSFVADIISSSGVSHFLKTFNSSEKKSGKMERLSSIPMSALSLQDQKRPLTSAIYEFPILESHNLQATDQKIKVRSTLYDDVDDDHEEVVDDWEVQATDLKIEEYSEAFRVDVATAKKILAYSKLQPTPISIEEFLTRGVHGYVSEKEEYTMLHEVLVRLAHMLMEMYYLPQQFKDLKQASDITKFYTKSFIEMLRVIGRASNDRDLTYTLKRFLNRHANTVDNSVKMLREDTSLTKCFPDEMKRLNVARLSIHMITHLHLMVYGSYKYLPEEISIVQSKDLCVNEAPELVLKTIDTIKEDNGKKKNVEGTHAPTYMYHIFFKTVENGILAKVEFHSEDQVNLNILQVQSDIRHKPIIHFPDDRNTVENKIFKDL